MSAVSGATKQVIIPPTQNEEIVRPRVAIPNEITQRFSIPKSEQIRHETILANLLLDRGDGFVKMPNGDVVHKDLVGAPSEHIPCPANDPSQMDKYDKGKYYY